MQPGPDGSCWDKPLSRCHSSTLCPSWCSLSTAMCSLSAMISSIRPLHGRAGVPSPPRGSQVGWPCPALTRGMQKRPPHRPPSSLSPRAPAGPSSPSAAVFPCPEAAPRTESLIPPFPQSSLPLCYFRICVQLALALGRRSCTECLGHFPAVSIMDNVQSGICGAVGSQIPVILRCWRANNTPTEPPLTAPKPFSPVLPAHQPGAAGVM